VGRSWQADQAPLLLGRLGTVLGEGGGDEGGDDAPSSRPAWASTFRLKWTRGLLKNPPSADSLGQRMIRGLGGGHARAQGAQSAGAVHHRLDATADPDDHVLARVDRVLDLSWLRDEVAELYCADNGRPGIDPDGARLCLGCSVRKTFSGVQQHRRGFSSLCFRQQSDIDIQLEVRQLGPDG
jgi:hypothetical protein